MEVTRRLQTHRKTASDGFVGVHVTPESSAEVPDTDEVRLVIVPPSHVHDRKRKDESPAIVWARGVTEHRGSAARGHRNTVVFLAADSARWAELDSAVRDFLAWSYVRDNAEGALNLTSQQRQQAIERVATHDQTVLDRLLQTYQWVLAPTQSDAARPFEIEALKAEGSNPQLADRTATKLRNESLLVLQRGAKLIRHDLDGRLRAVWDRDGHISFGQLWEYFTTYPYLARMRDRSVLEEGVMSVYDEMCWTQTGFALADSWDGEKYVGLVLPTDTATPPSTTDLLLLVRPDLAEAQRQREVEELEPGDADGGTSTPGDAAGDNTETSDGTGSGSTPSSGTSGRPTPPPPPAEKPKPRRFFGTTTLNPDFYGRDFSKITQEVIQNLAAVDGVQLEVRIEITATATEGFDEAKVRTVSENANTLKFEQPGFRWE